MAKDDIISQWEVIVEEEVERAVKAADKLLDYLGERPFGVLRLSAMQELQRLTDMLGSDADVATLASLFSFEELIAMQRRKRQLEERLGAPAISP